MRKLIDLEQTTLFKNLVIKEAGGRTRSIPPSRAKGTEKLLKASGLNKKEDRTKEDLWL